MMLVLNNGERLNDAPLNSAKTIEYLNKFWKFPQKEEIEKKKEKFYVVDYKREWHRKKNVTESEVFI